MPKERIFTPYPQDPADPGFMPFQLEVGWQKDQDVQVGVVTHDGRHLVDYIYADEEPKIGEALYGSLVEDGWLERRDFRTKEAEADFFKQLGRLVLDCVTGSTPFGAGVYWHPTRKQINEAIPLMRKARDSAYGRDA